jgi:chromosome segregation ATPase
MSERIAHIIQEIRDKFYQVKESYNREKDSNVLLQTEILRLTDKQEESERIIVQKQEVIQKLQAEINALNNEVNALKEAVPSVSDNDALIVDLVNEIDTCIGLLKK